MSSPATASVADMSRNVSTSENVNSAHNNSGVSAAQCTPVPLPALGIQRIIRGNGTGVGTVISLQCPARHRLMGEQMECVMGPNVTQWKGETYCKPLSSHEDYGFRVAVVASIVSSAIILLMSMAFITCCVVDCLNRGKKRHQEREADFQQREERVEQQQQQREERVEQQQQQREERVEQQQQQREERVEQQQQQREERVEQQQQSASRCSNKGRNNNNNNTSLWDDHDLELGDICKTICRYHQRYPCGGLISIPSSPYTLAPTLPAFALPGHGYNQPLLSQSSLSDPAQSSISSQKRQYPAGLYWGSCQTQNSALVQSSALLVWHHGRAVR